MTEKSTYSQNQKLDPKQREEYILKYSYLVKHIAGRMAVRIPSSVLFDELISAGCMGLIDAIDKYDPSREVDIKTYAEYRIKGAIIDELRSMDWYSRSMRKKIHDIEKAIHRVESREKRPAEDVEIAKELEIDIETYFKTLSKIHGAALLSLDEHIKGDDTGSLSGKTFQEGLRSNDDPTENVAKQELKAIMVSAIQKLSEKEQQVISLYYYDELTLKEIGHVLGVTESRICQIHSSALLKMRSRLKAVLD